MTQTADSQNPRDFRSRCDKAIEAFEMFQAFTSDMLKECNHDVNPSAVKGNFAAADEYYKKATELVNDLALWHAGRIDGKKLEEWSVEEIGQNALIRSLSGMISGEMNHLLTAYRPWLAKAQLTEVHTS